MSLSYRLRQPTLSPVTRGLALVKWIALLLFLQCFDYKAAESPLALDLGIRITPDRLVLLVIFTLALGKLLSGSLQFSSLGRIESYLLLFMVVCTTSSIVNGSGLSKTSGGYTTLTTLFDFIYGPFSLFVLVKNIPHSRRKFEIISSAFLFIGAYLAINGAFEHFGLHELVWPQYILDPRLGIQFGRTRGSFASSSALGGALVVTFLFYLRSATRLTGPKLYWVYLMLLITAGVIYTTNTRSAWVCFAFCVVLLALVRSEMKGGARVIAAGICLLFFTGVASHFGFGQATLFSQRQQTVDYRLVNYMTTIEMFKANPVFGIGYGNFKTEWRNYFASSPTLDIRELTDGNHNTFLGVLAETGLLGAALYLLIFYNMFRVGLRVFRRGDRFEREGALIFLLVLGVYVIDASFGDARATQFLNTVLFLLFGTVAGIEAQEQSLPLSPVKAPLPAELQF